MAGANLVDVGEEIVQVVQSLDSLIQGVHHVVGVFGQFRRIDLLLFGPVLAELFEHVQQIFVFFEQSVRSIKLKILFPPWPIERDSKISYREDSEGIVVSMRFLNVTVKTLEAAFNVKGLQRRKFVGDAIF